MEVEDLFPASDFDQWAGSYDWDVTNESRFPFEGYQRALETVVHLADAKPGMRVLDLGTGTGNLSALFVELGCRVWGTDFSEAMLSQARLKLPGMAFILADIRHDLPSELPDSFDRIVSAYVFHHFELPEKISMIHYLSDKLTENGCLVIADIAFPDQVILQNVRQQVGEDWEEEFYWLADETLAAIEQIGLEASFIRVSSMAGVFVIHKA